MFDGYDESPSTKDGAHLRRSGGKTEPEVHFDPTMKLQVKKKNFLANQKNKQRLIHMLENRLERAGCEVHHARGDADLLIVETAISSAQLQDTVVVANDTDILILLIHYKTSDTAHNIWLQSSVKKDCKKSSKCCNIKVTRELLGDIVSGHLLFAHALLGCDTTSTVFGIGKQKALTKLKSDANFLKAAAMFMSSSANVKDIEDSRQSAMIAIYNGRQNDNLDDLRYQRFCEKAAWSTMALDPCSLPPHHQQQSTTASGYINKCRCGWEMKLMYHQNSGVGVVAKVDLCH